MMRARALLTILVAALLSPLVLTLNLEAESAMSGKDVGWPSLRGPNQDGMVRGAGLAGEESFGLERVWHKPLGSGYSGVVAAGDRAITMFSDGPDDVMAAFDASTGEELWRYRVGDLFPAVGSSFEGPLSTPVIDGDRVYAMGPRGRVFAVSFGTGKELWSWQPEAPKEARQPYFGHSTAPLLIGGVLVVQTGGEGASVVALDPASGERRWTLGGDSVSYQSPAPFELDGREMVLTLSDSVLLGVDPASGEILWRHEHGLDGRAAMPTRIGDRRLLLNGSREILALDIVGPENGAYSLTEAWRSRDLVRTFALPLVMDGAIYSFSGRFLTAVDAATGERIWRSRPPGGRGLILVDGHVAAVDPQGDLVIGAVDREGFQELARAAALGADTYTAPTFAEGIFFVRNLEEIAALRLVDAPVADASLPVEGKLGEFLNNLGEEDRQAGLDAYLEGKDLPLMEEGGWVNILYRGEAKDAAVAASGLVRGESEFAMYPIPGTNAWARSVHLEPESRRLYRLVLDYDQRVPDPANPVSSQQGEDVHSEIRMPGWKRPDHLGASTESSGELTEIEVTSELYEEARKVQVYLPPGHQSTAEQGEGLPLLVMTYGQRVLERIEITRVLDHLITTGRIEPLAVAFVPVVGRREYRSEAEKHLSFLVDSLLPQLEKAFPLSSDAGTRGIFGVNDGGAMALYAALHAPGTFGRAAAMSFFAGGDQIAALGEKAAASAPENLRLYFDWTPWERTERAATMAAALESAGVAYVGGEKPGTSEWFSIAERIDRPLEALFPAP